MFNCIFEIILAHCICKGGGRQNTYEVKSVHVFDKQKSAKVELSIKTRQSSP